MCHRRIYMTEPDFETWASNIAYGPGRCNSSKIEQALKQAFEQGYHLGCREGYEEGLNQGWAIEQDKEHA